MKPGTGGQTNIWEEPTEIPQVIEVKQDIPVLVPVATTTSYAVRQGDTITGIAARYGLRWQDVVAVNPGVSPNKLQVGQVIQLPGQVDLSKTAASRIATPPKAAPAPSRTETVYVVKSGDSLSEIALKHGVKVEDIRKANDIKDANKIAVGQKLKIPGAVKSAAVVAPAHKAATAPKIDAPKPKPTEKEGDKPITQPPPLKEEIKENVAPVPPVMEVKEVKGDVKEDAAPTTTGLKYTVKSGEDLYAVAIRWGVSPSDLKALNNLTSSDLKEGMVLLIPSGGQSSGGQ
ncbi:MAG: LysM peptidoglycan-binding domain-containing protein [Kiritimatiellaeota bacterium]|nr:LysM peptidoglycan-binding domain-containing protein [Kiritimatiellota bacterium]